MTVSARCPHEREHRRRAGLAVALAQGPAHPGPAHPGRGLPARRAGPRGGLGPRDVSGGGAGRRGRARDSHGGSARVKAAHFPAVKTIDDFNFRVQTSVRREVIAHLAQLDFLAEAVNVLFLGPPGTGKTHLSVALAVQAARRGHRVAFATAHQWVNRLGAAKRAGRLGDELERLGRIPLLVVDEVGNIPFDPEAASLFFALISSRYERRSMIVSSNKTFSAWAEIFGDPVAVAAMVDRLVHHAEVIVLKGDSYRLRGKGEEVLTGTKRS
jgi:DNA replication protein DnaC